MFLLLAHRIEYIENGRSVATGVVEHVTKNVIKISHLTRLRYFRVTAV